MILFSLHGPPGPRMQLSQVDVHLRHANNSLRYWTQSSYCHSYCLLSHFFFFCVARHHADEVQPHRAAGSHGSCSMLVSPDSYGPQYDAVNWHYKASQKDFQGKASSLRQWCLSVWCNFSSRASTRAAQA